ncbi:MAG: twin-arginine translocase TatA/TatE family subunit [Chloroflexi bacterium]|nr:twin-arginine translocase TatA/TatE family subunit [Chloroflexota bacterium]
MPFSLGPMELIVVLVIVLIVFGVGRLPEIGGALGKGIKEFRRTQKDGDEETRSRAESKAEKKNEGS